LAARSAALRRLADAEKPLYQSLDEAQKRRFGIAIRFAARRHMAAAHPHGEGAPEHGTALTLTRAAAGSSKKSSGNRWPRRLVFARYRPCFP
jgi:hypothetical protein